MEYPRGIAVDSSGQISVSDTGLQQILRFDESGQVSTVAGTGVARFSGDAGAAMDAQLSFPWDVASASAGTMLIADLNNNRVRMLTASTQPVAIAAPLADAANAASLAVGPVAPEMLVLLQNMGLTENQLADTQVLFGSPVAQILSADGNGILIVAPQTVAQRTTPLSIFFTKTYRLRRIPAVVASAAPPLFADSSGHASANNQDGTVNSATNPAARGSIISLYGTASAFRGRL